MSEHDLVVNENENEVLIGGCTCGAYRYWTSNYSHIEWAHERHLALVDSQAALPPP